MSKPPTTPAQWYRSAEQTIQAQNQRQYQWSCSRAKLSHSLAPIAQPTTSGKVLQPLLSTISTPLEQRHQQVASGAALVEIPATMHPSTLALAPVAEQHGSQSFPTSLLQMPHTLVLLRSKAIFLAPASMRMDNSALPQDAAVLVVQ